ncbi:uncharacterized protein WCC33_019163 [Rhinophrynus dorsalis]
MATADLRGELNCSICQEIYTDPVTLTCGHNFCLVCINKTWDNQDPGDSSCPECRQRFKNRPELKRNFKLCNITECFISTHQKQGETGIFCTYCIHFSVPAAKSCLHCEASLCDNHLKVHSKSPEHVLTEPTTSLENRKCSIHKELLKFYCSEEDACICVSCCLAGDHRGHQVEPLNEASEKKKEQLRLILETLTSERQETEDTVQLLQERSREVQERAAGITRGVTALITDIRRQLEALEKQVQSEISKWGEQVSLSVSGLIQQFEIKKDKLSMKICHIKKLANTTDPLSVLQGQESDRADVCCTEERGDDGDTMKSDKLVSSIGDLDGSLIYETLHRGLAGIVTDVQTRICMQEATDILLDINTASKNVDLSGDMKTALCSNTVQRRPKTPERFQYDQVLSTRSFFSGRHYWDLKIGDSGTCMVGVAYPSIERKGRQSEIGYNNKSWCLCLFNENYTVIHDSKLNIMLKPFCKKIRISLDYEAGHLSFLELCDSIRHLHTFTATFSEPLHVAFRIWDDACVRILMMATPDLRGELICSICQEIYTDPVTLTCGHNFCLVCITNTWDNQDPTDSSCPECRQRFKNRPELKRNLRLCNIVERFLSTHQQKEETRVICTYCIHSSVPAAKSCLLCEASLCDNHLRVHSKSPEHVLIEPTTSLGNRKCSIHKKVLEFYCSEDAACICVYCRMETKHRGHQVKPLNEAAEQKKEGLRKILEKWKLKREETERSVQGLRREVQEIAAGETERVTALIVKIREQLEALEIQVQNELSRWEEQVSLLLSGLIQQMEIKKDKLSGKISHIEEMCNMADPVTVLQIQESDTAEVCVTGEEGYEDIETDITEVPAVSDLNVDMISWTLNIGLFDIVTDIESFHVQEVTDMLLDINTAGNYVDVSRDRKTASFSFTVRDRLKTPERFQYDQVLSTNTISSGKHYWEMEGSESRTWMVGVAYPSIERQGPQSGIGYNNKSWCLYLHNNSWSVIHDCIVNNLPHKPSCRRIRIFLDYEAGRLSFYELCHPVRHLHTFTATFTEPLHAAFSVYNDTWVRFLR